jgi:hypothetical protein
LPWGTSVYVKIVAVNIKGDSEPSLEGNGALLLRAPDAPTQFQNEPTITSLTQIGLSWQDGTWDGGSAILDYKISYAVGTDGEYTIMESGVT